MTGAIGGGWTFEAVDLSLPKGAFAGGGRRILRREGRPVAGFTDGRFRPFLHPLWTPSGAVVTAEAPADHPHHAGLWLGADHVNALMPATGGPETYTYNFYVNDVFQGRAPGTIAVTGEAAAGEGSAARIVQRLEWRGPREWGAPEGRTILSETRTTVVREAAAAVVIDIVCELSAPLAPVEIGPTRHAFFNVRVADSMSLSGGGGPLCSRGHCGATAVSGDGAAWVDFSGPVGHEAMAGVALMPAPDAGSWWFVADWGVMTASPVRAAPLAVDPGAPVRLCARAVIHDGTAGDVDLAGHHEAYLRDMAS
jgi:hypothetical protein